MRNLTVARSELTRVLPWSLRALGYAFGTADRGAHLAANAASLSPDVLDDLIASGPRPVEGFDYSAEPAGLHIRAAGTSFLEVGPVAMDYLGAYCPTDGAVTCRIDGCSNIELTPAVLLIGADYGLSSLALMPSTGKRGWILSRVSGDSVSFYSGEDASQLPTVLGGNTAFSGWAADPNDDGSALTLLAMRSEPAVGDTTLEAQYPMRRIAAADAHGIPISSETLHALYALEEITWAPTSERSRAQAGFTQKAVSAA